VIHSHVDFLAFPCASLVPTPTVTTLHGRLDLPDLPRVYARFPDMPVVSISDSQREPLPEANWVGTVYNGIDIGAHSFARGGDYLAFLGRISPDKGLDRAIDIARRAGLPLKVAARMPLENSDDAGSRADWDYYRAVIEPLFEGPDVEYVGEVGDADRAAFLGNALALLFPIDWPEPFGLVMAEALACGTPVVARRRGSVPEVINHGVTGLIGESDDELAELCRRVGDLSREACRAEAEERFSASAMVGGYEEIYRRVLAPGDADPAPRPPSAGTRLGDVRLAGPDARLHHPG
jgi:glycosyltransferase involved in cell wall biosynthesis